MSDEEPSSRKFFDIIKNNRLYQRFHGLFQPPKGRRDVLAYLREASDRQVIDLNALTMIEGVLSIPDVRVRDIMIPRSQMIVIEKDMTLKEILSMVLKTVHSRFPVIGDSKDEILGILLAKDLLPFGFPDVQSIQPFNLQTILRPVSFIPESKRLDVLLQEFRAARNHMAMVVDEYGGITGLVTIEDVLEEIVGNIEDEYDTEDDKPIRKYEHGSFLVRALTPIDEFNRYFDADFDDSEMDTVGGLIMRNFGHLPKKNEKTQLGRFEFKVLRADRRRIYLLQVHPLLSDQPETD